MPQSLLLSCLGTLGHRSIIVDLLNSRYVFRLASHSTSRYLQKKSKQIKHLTHKINAFWDITQYWSGAGQKAKIALTNFFWRIYQRNPYKEQHDFHYPILCHTQRYLYHIICNIQKERCRILFLKWVIFVELLQAIRISVHLETLAKGRTQVIFPGFTQIFPGFTLRG